MSSINIAGANLAQTSDAIIENVAIPYKNNEDDFFKTIEEFVNTGFISNASKVKAQQIINQKPHLDNMYRCMMEYADFLNFAKKEFKAADDKSVDMFHRHNF